MSSTISGSRDFRYRLFPFSSVQHVNLESSFESHLSKIDKLTKEKALSILEKIEFESNMKSLLFKPVVLFCAGAAVLALGILMPAVTIVQAIAGLILSFIGGFIIGYSIGNTLNGTLPGVSSAYSEQAKKSREQINLLNSAKQSFWNQFASQ